MNEKITIHGNPEESVFGLVGKDIITDEDKLYIKVANDSKNTGWREIPPTPTPTPTITVTPSKTPIVTRVVNTTPTPTSTVTPTLTPSVTSTQPAITPTPTNTPFKQSIRYTIAADGGGTAARIDGASPSGTISVGTGTMQLQAIISPGYMFDGWIAPESVTISDPYSLNPIASGFSTYTDVVITAKFVPQGTHQVCPVTGTASGRGIINFNYINDLGVSTNLSAGYSPFVTIFNIVDAIQIIRVNEGQAILNCPDPNLPPEVYTEPPPPLPDPYLDLRFTNIGIFGISYWLKDSPNGVTFILAGRGVSDGGYSIRIAKSFNGGPEQTIVTTTDSRYEYDATADTATPGMWTYNMYVTGAINLEGGGSVEVRNQTSYF